MSDKRLDQAGSTDIPQGWRTRIRDYGASVPQRLLPKRALSALMLCLTRVRFAPWKNWQIRWFVRRYGVDLALAAEPDTRAYPHFNAFFTRALRTGARPCAEGEGVVTSPADGVLSEFGEIREGALLHAKGHSFTVERLLGGDATRARAFETGAFFTVYLSPRDYHRVHMPLGGRLREMVYVPGKLFSVSLTTVRRIPELLARNERVVSQFETTSGPMALVMVGAVFVGSIEQVWHGVVTPPRCAMVRTWRYDDDPAMPPVTLAPGAEAGRFNMGSTVVVLLGAAGVAWAEGLAPGTPVRVGQQLATVTT